LRFTAPNPRRNEESPFGGSASKNRLALEASGLQVNLEIALSGVLAKVKTLNARSP